jgi:hypothetical protein
MSVKILAAINHSWDIEKTTDKKADNLPNKIYMYIRAWVMHSTNLWIDMRLVNSLLGIVIDIT